MPASAMPRTYVSTWIVNVAIYMRSVVILALCPITTLDTIYMIVQCMNSLFGHSFVML